MPTIAITGINSYFAQTVLPKLEADPEIEKRGDVGSKATYE